MKISKIFTLMFDQNLKNSDASVSSTFVRIRKFIFAAMFTSNMKRRSMNFFLKISVILFSVKIEISSEDQAMRAYLGLNSRYYAGRMVQCQFVNIPSWSAAICGRTKTCFQIRKFPFLFSVLQVYLNQVDAVKVVDATIYIFFEILGRLGENRIENVDLHELTMRKREKNLDIPENIDICEYFSSR